MDQLYFVVHTHWDREWYEPFQRMRARLVTMTDRMLGLVEAGDIPCFHFDGQTIVLEDYLELRPQSAGRIARLVKAGKIQIGPWYVLADSFLVSGESLIRNLQIGGRVARRFGRPLEIGYLPDQFGHIAQMPQILAGFGLKAAMVWRGVPREIDRNRFVWQALDGTAIFTTYLPYGYSNGASFPSQSVTATLARAGEIAERERSFAAGTPILVMNGTDHAHPDPQLIQRLKEAPRDGLSFEVGTLEAYVKRLSELPPDDAARTHRGELRSPARAHLLPGVTSARAWIKQRDFLNCYLLERLADPLAALAGLGGQAEDLDAFLDLAWRMEIQNHPHDSICGCSIDQVHQDMRYRFDQASILGEMVVRRASRAILGDGGGAPAIAVFNPSFARQGLASGEVEVEDASSRYSVESAQGRRIPAAIEIARAGRAFETEITAADFKRVVAGLSSPELMGRFVNRFELRRPDTGPARLDLFMSRNALSDLDLESFKRTIADLPENDPLKIRAVSPARAHIGFVADDLAQAGFSFYRLVREDGAKVEPPSNDPALTADQSIASDRYRLTPSARGLEIRELQTGRRFELYFEDDGDRGDEYNFDPVDGAPILAQPESMEARVLERGPVRSRLAVSLSYRLPAGLAPDRRARAAQTASVGVELLATLYAGLDRVDFELTVDNRAMDHRLRAALATPIDARQSLSDTSFGMIRRPLEPQEPPGTEEIYPTAPHRTLCGVESPELSAALVGRGLYEGEVRRDSGGASVLLTLLRCVGWLSRSDLRTRRGGAGPEMETPGAQEIGRHRFEFALITWKGAYSDSAVVQRCDNYAFPPRLFGARWTPERPAPGLGQCDNPQIVFSTVRRAERGAGYLLRAFSSSDKPETACFKFATGCAARIVDLAGRAVPGAAARKRRDASVEVKFRPFQIVTFEVREARGGKIEKNFRASATKD